MADSPPADARAFPADAPASVATDSIAGQLAARLAQLPTSPIDAMDWTTLALAYEYEARAVGAGPSAGWLFHEAGRIHEERIGDPRQAMELYRAAAESAPQRVHFQAARRMARSLGESEIECDLIRREATVVSDPRDRSALELLRARILEYRLQRPEEAREAHEAAAIADPGSMAVAEHEVTLAVAAGRADEVSAALVRCAERSVEPPLAAGWLCAAAEVESGLGRAPMAADLALRAFELVPGDAATRASALRHARRAERWESVTRLLAAEATAPETGPREAALALCEQAHVAQERLGRVEDAREALRQARGRALGDSAILDALARAHEVLSDWEGTAEVLRVRVAGSGGGPEERTELVTANLRLAEICEEHLKRDEEAESCYRAVLTHCPGHRTALTALGRLYARSQRWELLLETFLAERDVLTDPRERAHRCFKAGELLEERLNRPDEAIALHVEAQKFDPTLIAARQALERLYTRRGRHIELAQLLDGDVAATQDREEQVAILFKLMRLHEEQLSDPEGAAKTCERILTIAPGHVFALRRLADLNELAGRYSETVATLQRLAELSGDTASSVGHLQKAAELQEEQLHDSAAATATHEKILQRLPLHPPSLRALGRLYAGAERWADWIAMCRAEAEISPSIEGAAALLYRAGEIFERRLAREVEAISAYREVLTLSPSHPAALRALARLHRRRGEWESLVEILRSEAATRPAPEQKALLLADAADICEQKLREPERALELHGEALQLVPGFAASSSAAERLLTSRERWGEVVRVAYAEAAQATGVRRNVALLRAARVLFERMGDSALAEETCRAVLAESPGDLAACMLLLRLPGTGADARDQIASRIVDPRQAEQLREAATLERAAIRGDAEGGPGTSPDGGPQSKIGAARAQHLEAQRDAASDPGERAMWALRAAEAWEDTGDLPRAAAGYAECLSLSPSWVPALRAIRRVQGRLGAWQEVRRALQQEAGALRDPAMASAALVEAGEIALSRFGDHAGAAADWMAALAHDPCDAAIVDRLAVLLSAAERHLELCEIFEKRAAAERSPDAASQSWVAAAEVAMELDDRPRALADIERGLEVRPASAEALRLRARLLSTMGRHAEAARDLSACLLLELDPVKKAALHLGLVGLYDGPLADQARAMSHLNAVLALAPENAEALTSLARMHRANKNWPAAADVLKRLIALPSLPPDSLRSYLLELADVQGEGFGDAAAALESCERALELTPRDPQVLERISRFRGRAGEHPGVASVLAAAASARGAREQARAHLRAARVLSGALGDSGRAIEALRAAIRVDPDQIEARLALAGLCATEDPALAIEEHRQVLARDASRVESWRALFDLFMVRKEHDTAFLVAGILNLLGSADPARDGAFYAKTALSAPRSTSGVLEEWGVARHSGDRGPLSALLAIVGDALAEVASIPPPPRERDPKSRLLVPVVEEICSVLGIPPFAVRPGIEGPDLSIAPGDPPAVFAGPDTVRRLGPSEQRFLVARAAARLRSRSALASRLDPRALGELMAAVVHPVAPDYEGLGHPSAEQVKAVARALPRKLKKIAEGPSRVIARSGTIDVAAWQASLAASADRVGLLLSADVPAALRIVLGECASARGAAEVGSALGHSRFSQLALFAISEEHLALRQHLRLAVT